MGDVPTVAAGRVVVVGAGLSGLATAWCLSERGAPVHVVEAASRPGGLIQTLRVPEGMIETAARAFPWTPRTDALFAAAGVPPIFAREESKRRYVYRDGRPRRWPLSWAETGGAAARFGLAWARRQVRPRGAETVECWGARVLGRAATTWLLAPALQGIYASPPGILSASALFGQGRPRGGKLGAPRQGMGELIEALQRTLEQRGVTFEFGRRLSDIEVAGSPAVICTSAPAAARLLAREAPALAAALARIRMVSLALVTAFFAPHPDDLRGFGILFPRQSGIGALGAIFNADVFTDRSRLRSETWIYGDLNASSLPATDDELIAQMGRDRSALTSRSGAPQASYVTRQPGSLPLYDTAVLDARAALATLPPRLAIAGNYVGRLGVSSLLDGAADAAARVLDGHPDLAATPDRRAAPDRPIRARRVRRPVDAVTGAGGQTERAGASPLGPGGVTA